MDKIFKNIAKENNITVQDAKFIFENSQEIMPLLLIHYKADLNIFVIKLMNTRNCLPMNVKRKIK
jgi:hypothetical protein